MKRIKRAMVATMMMSILFGAIPVMAANTSDTYYTKYTCSGGWEDKIAVRSKHNSTKVYSYIYTSPESRMQVRAYGYANGAYTNQTRGGVAYVYIGEHTSITNYIYETGHRNASIGIRTNSESYYGTVSGKWSPDSTKNYKVAN